MSPTIKCEAKINDNCEKNGDNYFHMKRVCNYCFWRLKCKGKSSERRVYSKNRNGIFVKSATFKMGEIKPK